jgi:hypothetical protein
MADSAGGVGNQIGEFFKDFGKDIVEQVGGKSQTTNTTQANQQNPQLAGIQRNIKIANLSRRIQLFKQRQTQVQQQAKQQEQHRLQQMQQETQQKEHQKQEGFGTKTKNKLSNWINTLARRNKGEQRGNKTSG